MPFPEPETARLRCRTPRPSDVDQLHALFADPDVMRHIGAGTVWDRDEIARRIERGIGMIADGKPYLWTVERRDTGEVIGQGGLVAIDFNGPETELGYRLGRAHWDHGFATEIARAAVECAFTPGERGGLGLDRLVALCYLENTASRRVLAKAGFVKDGMTDAYYGVTSLRHEHRGPNA